MVPLDYIPQRQYADTSDASGKRNMASMATDASAKGAARGCKKSKPLLSPVAAVSLDDHHFARCV